MIDIVRYFTSKLLKTKQNVFNCKSQGYNSPGHNHFWISVSSFVIGRDQNQNKANLAERYWTQEEAECFFFCGGHVVMGQ